VEPKNLISKEAESRIVITRGWGLGKREELGQWVIVR
jgi:hypothetical protein